MSRQRTRSGCRAGSTSPGIGTPTTSRRERAKDPNPETALAKSNDFRIAVFAGDGIGHEITGPCVAVIDRALALTGGTAITPVRLRAGAGAYVDIGEALPAASLSEARKADAILLAA